LNIAIIIDFLKLNLIARNYAICKTLDDFQTNLKLNS